jgi:hypothetical protein
LQVIVVPGAFRFNMEAGELSVRSGNYFTISERPKTELTKAFFDLMLKIMFEPVKGKKG